MSLRPIVLACRSWASRRRTLKYSYPRSSTGVETHSTRAICRTLIRIDFNLVSASSRAGRDSSAAGSVGPDVMGPLALCRTGTRLGPLAPDALAERGRDLVALAAMA